MSEYDLGTARGRIELDATDAKKGAEDAKKSLQGVSKESRGVGQRMQDTGKRASKMGDTLTKRVSGPIIGVVGGLAAMATKAAETGDRLDKTSQKLGISTDALQEMDYWASQNGLSQQSMERAVGRLNQRIGRAIDGNKKYSEAFETLGISIQDTNGNARDTESVMAETVQALSEIEDPAMRSARASEIFGTKMARDLQPALSEGALSLDDAKNQAHELGLVMSEEAIGASVRFSDALDQTKRTLGTVGREVGSVVMPMLADKLLPAIRDYLVPAIKGFVGWINDAVDWFGRLPGPVKAVALGLVGFAAAIGPILSIGGRMITLFGKLISNVKNLLAVGKKAIALFSKLVAAISPWMIVLGLAVAAIILLYRESETFRDIVHGVWDSVKKAIRYAWERVIKPAWDAIYAFIDRTLIPAFNEFMKVVETVWKAISAAIKFAWNNVIKPLWDSIKWFIDNALVPAFMFMLSTAETVWEAISGAIKFAWNNIIKPLWEAVKWYIDNMLAPVFRFMQAVAEDVFGLISTAIKFAWEEVIKPVWDAIKRFIDETLIPVFNLLWTIIESVWNDIKGAISAAWNETIKPIWETIKEWIEDTLGPVFDTFKGVVEGVWKGVKDAIKTAWDTISGIFDSIKEAVEGPLSSIWETFKGAAQGAWNAVLGTIRNVLRKLASPVSSFLSMAARVADAIGMSNLAGIMRGAVNTVRGWSNLPAAHSGGVIGEMGGPGSNIRRPGGRLRKDEEWRVLRRGEEVMTEDDPRHIKNEREQGGLWDRIKDMAGSAVDRLRNLIANTARPAINAAMNSFSNVANRNAGIGSMIPNSLRTVGRGLLDWISGVEKNADKRQQELTAGGTANLGGSGSVTNRLVQAFLRDGPPGRFTSGYRPGDPGLHGKRRAADFAGPVPSSRPTAAMNRIFDFFKKFKGLRELIYNGMPWNIIRGNKVPTSSLSAKLRRAHDNHVHVAMAMGGIATRPTRALIGESGPEAVIPLRKGLRVPELEHLMSLAVSEIASMHADLVRMGPVMGLERSSKPMAGPLGGAARVGGHNGAQGGTAATLASVEITQEIAGDEESARRGTLRALRQVATGWGM